MQRLAKLAKVSSALRAGVIKEAGLLGTLISAAAKSPVTAAMTTVGAVGGAKAVKGKSDQYKQGFDPAVNQAMLGIPPKPPGTT